MKKIKGILSLILALILVLGLCACGGNKGNEGTTEDNGEPISFAAYTMIRPQKASNALTKSVSDLYMALTEIEGCEVTLATDMLTGDATPDSAVKEILIGVTNRPETAQAIEKLSANEFCVGVIGNKIVITGYTNEITYAAVDYFTENYLGDGTNLTIPSNLFYKGTVEDAKVIIDKGEVKYKIVRPDKATDKQFLSMVSNLCNNIYSQTEIFMDVTTDRSPYDENAYEILIGDTSYPETAQLKAEVGPDDYKIKFIGNKIVIFSYNVEGYSKAISDLDTVFRFSYNKNEAGEYSLSFVSEDMGGKYGEYNYYTEDIPYSVDGVYFNSSYDAYDNTMMLYWEGATEAMFNSYCSSLQSAGFILYQQGANNSSIVARTYTKDKALAHVYFFKRVGELRVITQDNANLPVNPSSYTKVCDPVIVQLKLDYTTVIGQNDAGNDTTQVGGMGYVIRLADGTFVVIDGGNYMDYDIQNLYDTMNSLKVGTDKIVVSAWILTHGHSDHYGVLKGFMDKHNNDIIVKTLISNDLSNDLYKKTDMIGRAFNHNSVKGKFGGCTVTKAHTGMTFSYPGVKFTIVATHEDYYPHNYDADPLNEKYNSFSSMNIIAESDSGKRAIWLGDLEKHDTHASQLVARYKTDLKCDIMQVAHHGVEGGSLTLYQTIDPDIALWSAKKSLANSYTTGKNSQTQNVWLTNNCTIHYNYNGNKQLDFK